MVIVTRLSRVNTALPAQNRAEHFFGRGFADRSRHPHDFRFAPRTARRAKRCQCRQDIRHDQQRRRMVEPVGNMADNRRCCPF